MTYSPLLLVHIFGGVIGFVSGSAALIVRKGSPLHRKSGNVFVISMLAMASSGAVLAVMKTQPGNVLAGVFTFYLFATAWLTVRRKERTTGRSDVALLLVALGVGTGAWILASNASGSSAGDSAAPFLVFGVLALLCAAGDARVLIRGGASGAQRIVRHLWRMGFGLFIAAGSFFLGMPGDPVLRRSGLRATLFPPAVRHTHLPEIPVLLILVLIVYWLCRVLLTNEYKKAALIRTEPVASVANRPVGDFGLSSHEALD